MPTAVWTLDEVAGRFELSIGEAIRVMSDLEAIDVVRRIDDEYVPRVPGRDRLLGGRCDRERLGLRFDRTRDRAGLLEPCVRQRTPAVERPQERTRHRRVRVGVAAERHDPAESFLEAGLPPPRPGARSPP